MKNSTEKIFKGALVGATLAVVAGVLLSSDEGKKMSKKIAKNTKKLSADFYNYITPQIKELKQLGEVEYTELVSEGIKKYAKIKKLSLREKKILSKEAENSWKHIKKQLK